MPLSCNSFGISRRKYCLKNPILAALSHIASALFTTYNTFSPSLVGLNGTNDNGKSTTSNTWTYSGGLRGSELALAMEERRVEREGEGGRRVGLRGWGREW